MITWQLLLLGVAIPKLLFAVGIQLWMGGTEGSHPHHWIFAGLIIDFGMVGVFLIYQSRGSDRRAQLLGVLLVLVASPFADPLLGSSRFPPGGTTYWLAVTATHIRIDAWIPALLWGFTSVFPEPLLSPRDQRWARSALLVSTTIGVVLFVANMASIGQSLTGESSLYTIWNQLLFDSGGLYWTVLFLAAVPAWPFLLWRARHTQAVERRRIMVFVVGLILGLAPMAIEVILEALIPPYRLVVERASNAWIGTLLYLCLAATPLVTAYSVIVDRVLDVRIIVRLAIQYFLARVTIFVAIAAPFGGLVVYVYSRRDQTLTQIMSGPGPIVLVALTAFGILGLGFRERIIAELDRRFFREQYDARQILATLADEPRQLRDLNDFVVHATTEIDRALHLHSIYFLVADDAGGILRCIDGGIRPLPVSSRLVTLFSEDQSPFEIDLESSASSVRSLPIEDRQWLADSGARLLAPLMNPDGLLLGVLALGEKRSELGFSREDRNLLGTIQQALALRLENRRLRSSPIRFPGSSPEIDHAVDDAARECRECGSVFAHGTGECECGSVLQRAPVPHVLLGKFRVHKRIGAGGMGVVYRAVDLSLDRTVAIKTLPRVSPESASRLRREARAMAVVSHTNLALIFGAEMWHGTPMLICEYLSGGTLADRLRLHRLAIGAALDLGVAMADVLAHIHDVGIIHCDVKPSNIGYTAAGVPKLLDFGLARLANRTDTVDETATRSSSLVGRPVVHLGSGASNDSRHFVGTPLYMSPEAIRQEVPSTLFDLWSVSVVLFEAIAGTTPYGRHARADVLDRIVDGGCPDLREFLPACPAAVASFFKGALSPNRTDRPQTAHALRKALVSLHAASQ